MDMLFMGMSWGFIMIFCMEAACLASMLADCCDLTILAHVIQSPWNSDTKIVLHTETYPLMSPLQHIAMR
jgi:hypothetical protein